MPTIHFKGKSVVKNYHYAVPFHTIEIDKQKSLGRKSGLDGNLIIQGDNLVALKALLPTHTGKIKCIYADPPYNTGKEGWRYNDAVNSPLMRNWLDKEVGTEDLERHDKWCCMIYPRMQLLRELMRDDGVIFVSMDDNEVGHLRMIMDEIFGEENFVRQIVWEKKFSPQNDAKFFSTNHEYLLCYARQLHTLELNRFPKTGDQISFYNNPDSDPRGPWQGDNLSVPRHNREASYIIETPSGRKINPPPGSCWRFSKYKFQELKNDNRISFGASGDNVPSIKRFLSEVRSEKTPISIWSYKDIWGHKEVGHTQSATQQLIGIFDNKRVFDYPKPVGLIKRCLQLATDPGDIVLDSFAGSGTTGHATLALNAEEVAARDQAKESLDFENNGDKPAGGRRFILIECEDYVNDITAERIRRVSKGIAKSSDPLLKKGLKGTFTYCALSKEPLSADRLSEAKSLPGYLELARYIYYSATGKNLDEAKVKTDEFYLGMDGDRVVYLYYRADTESLKKLALDLDQATRIGRKHGKKEKLVYAPQTILEEWDLRERNISFVHLPFIPGL